MTVNAISCEEVRSLQAELSVEQAKELSHKAKVDAVLKMAYAEVRTAVCSHKKSTELPVSDLQRILDQNDWSTILLEVADILRPSGVGKGGGYVVEECKGKFLINLDPPILVSPVSLRISGW